DAAYRELEATNAKLKETSFKDEVTGLYNRRFFSLRLEEEISRFRRFNHPVSVVVLDLDGFKSVNDEFGHAVGDETLRDVGQILMKHSRGINVVSRYGGDEFAVLLVETSKSGARLYADRIRQVVATFPYSPGQPVTASLGAGYKCLLANDGLEGVEVFRASIRDSRSPLTVTDLKMPIMGGIDLLQHVRQADPDAAVIVLTGAADVKTAIASLKLGAYDFIMKPVNVDELLIAADRALERR